MNFLKFPLHDQRAGATATVTLDGVESDVFLVDGANLRAFERGRDFHYHGGHFNQSPGPDLRRLDGRCRTRRWRQGSSIRSGARRLTTRSPSRQL